MFADYIGGFEIIPIGKGDRVWETIQSSGLNDAVEESLSS